MTTNLVATRALPWLEQDLRRLREHGESGAALAAYEALVRHVLNAATVEGAAQAAYETCSRIEWMWNFCLLVEERWKRKWLLTRAAVAVAELVDQDLVGAPAEAEARECLRVAKACARGEVLSANAIDEVKHACYRAARGSSGPQRVATHAAAFAAHVAAYTVTGSSYGLLFGAGESTEDVERRLGRCGEGAPAVLAAIRAAVPWADVA